MQPAEPKPRRILLGAALILALPLAGCALLEHPLLQLQARLELNRANRAYGAGDYEAAVRGYDRVVSLFRGAGALPANDQLAEAELHRGYALMALQRSTVGDQRVEVANRAIASFREYLRHDGARGEVDPRRVEEYMLSLYLDANQPEKALGLLQAWFRRDPRDATVAFRIAQHYAEQGDVPQAVEWYRKRIEIKPQDPEMRYALGVFAWQVSYYNRALSEPDKRALVEGGLQQLQQAIELRADYFEAYSYVNLLYRELAKLSPRPSEQRRLLALAEQNLAKALELREARMKQGATDGGGEQATQEGR
ncbi:MAG TPA: tetratricopeptide repeat protein [Acidobacteriota bacterium]